MVELTRRHHAFDNDHILARGNLLIAADHVLEQQVEFAIGQLTLDLLQWQRLGRQDIQGAFYQNARAFTALIVGEGLGDGLEEANLQPGALECADQAEADGVEAAAKTAGGEE